MARKKRKRQPRKTFRFQLTPGGVVGIGIVCFCLLMWMFLLGIWAGQTILLPSAPSEKLTKNSKPPVQVLMPEGKKKRK